MAQRFVVIGAGAIGCRVGGALAGAGANVTFVARAGRAADLAGKGLVLTDLDGATLTLPPDRFRVVAAARDAAQGEGEPVLLLCTKGGDTAAAAAEAGAAFRPGTPVLSLQNGVDNVGRIRTAALRLLPLAAMVPFNVTLDREANGRIVVRQTTSGALHAEDHAVTRALAPLFAAAGLPLTLVADMVPVQWGKLLLNLNNPVNALSGLPLREELTDRDCRRALAALQDEALAVMKAAGIRPARIGAAPPRLIPTILRLPTFAFSRIAASMLTIAPTARSSMADDLAAGRPTEIDDLCGAVVRLARTQGLGAPRNAAMMELVAGRRPGTAMSGRDILAAVMAA
jgi:2-dehydropantoate 2-reductase